jgi:hypothetical protein
MMMGVMEFCRIIDTDDSKILWTVLYADVENDKWNIVEEDRMRMTSRVPLSAFHEWIPGVNLLENLSSEAAGLTWHGFVCMCAVAAYGLGQEGWETRAWWITVLDQASEYRDEIRAMQNL